MEVKNYFKINNGIPWRLKFGYLDTEEYLADHLFLNENLKVKFKSEFQKPGCKYIIVFCTISTKDLKKFENTMEKLKQKMLLTGHHDYPDMCQEISNLLTKEREG